MLVSQRFLYVAKSWSDLSLCSKHAGMPFHARFNTAFGFKSPCIVFCLVREASCYGPCSWIINFVDLWELCFASDGVAFLCNASGVLVLICDLFCSVFVGQRWFVVQYRVGIAWGLLFWLVAAAAAASLRPRRQRPPELSVSLERAEKPPWNDAREL